MARRSSNPEVLIARLNRRHAKHVELIAALKAANADYARRIAKMATSGAEFAIHGRIHVVVPKDKIKMAEERPDPYNFDEERG